MRGTEITDACWPVGLRRDVATGRIVLTSAALAEAALRDPHLAAMPEDSACSEVAADADRIPSLAEFFQLWYQRGANHPALRPYLRAAYAAGSVDQYADRFTLLARDLLQRAPDSGDLMHHLVDPYALQSTLLYLGFPESRWTGLTGVYRVLMAVVRSRFRGVLELDDRTRAGFGRALAYLAVAVRELREQPEPHPLGVALNQYADAHGTGPWEDAATVTQLLAAGVPQLATGLAVACRAMSDGQWSQLVDRGEVPAVDVAEEAMRLIPPFLAIFAWAREPCDCLGVRIPAGTAIIVDIAAVNTDGAAIERPHQFCPARRRNSSITFGKGSHYCLGARSARVQIASSLTAVAEHHPRIVIDRSAVRFQNDGFSQTVRSLPYRMSS